MNKEAVGPIGQGTRVASPVQGTINGPKQPPPRTQLGGTESVPNTQSTVTQVRGWPANVARAIFSRRAGRESQIETGWELQTGPEPPRILRQMFERMRGQIGGEAGQATFPYNAEWSLLIHHTIPREAQRTGPYVKGTDDGAAIPAIYAGNPRLG